MISKHLLLFSLLILLSIHLSAQEKSSAVSEITLIASTPADSLLKSVFRIPQEERIDFVRWNLVLKNKNNIRSFLLNINYGESQQNTLGFTGGGQKRSLNGTFTITRGYHNNPVTEVYHLQSKDLSTVLSIVRISENLFHLLTSDQRLMTGNGGWSYSLNNKDVMIDLPPNSFTSSAALLKDTALHIIYEGRTPCAAFAKHTNLATNECLKVKWDLQLHRDPVTHLPTTYRLNRTQHRKSAIEGKWKIIKGFGSNPHAMIYQLDPDQPDDTISLLAGDENVLFFIGINKQLLVGDHNFSFTLNRRRQ